MKQSCLVYRPRPDTTTMWNLKQCRAQCSECYYSKVCLPGKFKHKRFCCLGSKKYVGPLRDSACSKVCKICGRLSLTEQTLRREARDRFLIRRSARETEACSECGALLRNNRPFWWICSMCSCECQDHIHPPWFERIDV